MWSNNMWRWYSTFISIDDLLNRYLNEITDIAAVALYKTDGTCKQKKARTITK